MSRTILVDIDGVVANLLPAWVEIYNQRYNDDLRPGDITQWNMTQFVKPECGKDIYKILFEEELYEQVDPIPGAREGIEQLRETGHRVVFLSSGNEVSRGAKIRWLREHGFIEPASQNPNARGVINAEEEDKELIRGDLMIDDYVGNLEQTEMPGVLFGAPYNQQHADRFPRVKNWDELLQHITRRFRQAEVEPPSPRPSSGRSR